jgi:2-methylcitrate dehydratase PrpD
MRERGLSPDELQEIVITTNTWGFEAVGEGESKYKPKTIMDAQFSIPYAVGTALAKGDVFIDDFTDQAIRNKEVIEYARKVKVKVNPELDKIPLIPPINVEIKTKDGRSYEKYVEYVKGHPKNPMSMSECIEKFTKCVPFSAKPLSNDSALNVIDMVERLEEITDVTEITRMIS